MANIINYIKEYGDKDFKSLPFNDIDATIFTCLSYNEFEHIVPKNNKKITIKEAADIFYKTVTKKELISNVIGVQMGSKVLTHIRNKTRYKDLLLYNYYVKRDDNHQFSALFIDIDNKSTFISFEGTDDLISSWKEDFQIAYTFPVKSQMLAIKYINTKIPLITKRRYIMGGHSKGGNLCLTALMYANPIIKSKIDKIYSLDGLGLKSSQFNSRLYKNIEDRIRFITPNYSIVGLLLENKQEYEVVLSNSIGILAHDVITWQIDKTSFVKARLSIYSKGLDKIFTNWFNKYTKEECIMFTDDLFNIFSRCGVKSIIDIKFNIYKIMNILKETSNINDKSKKMIKEFLNEILAYIKSYNKY